MGADPKPIPNFSRYFPHNRWGADPVPRGSRDILEVWTATQPYRVLGVLGLERF